MRRLKRLYEVAWRATTGRPLTYQLRDWSRHHPLRVWPIVALTTAGFFGVQMQLVIWFGWKAAAASAFTHFMAFVGGHLAWGWGPFTRSVDDFRKSGS